tara:strand:- start:2380 stop:3015 length:636 start_codon:yes stop_codon:yes gene_type:complete
MKLKKYLLIFTCFIFFQLYYNKQIIYYILNNKKCIPTPTYIINIIKKTIINDLKINRLILANNFIFYDIGSGDGNTINNIFEPNMFKKYIGIEYDSKTHLDSNPISNQINLILDNALTYNYINKPSVIYLYEPFYSFNYNTAKNMYYKLFKQITNKCKKPIYLIYLTGDIYLGNPHLYKSNLLNKYKLISKKNIYRPLLFKSNILLVYKIN